MTKQVFICYSKKDKYWRDKIHEMLYPALRSGEVDIWWDGMIAIGDEWRGIIDNALQQANFGLILVSPNLLSSDFVTQVELPYLFQAAKQKKLRICWVLIDYCLYENTVINTYQAAYSTTKPLRELHGSKRSKAIKDLVSNLLNLVSIEEENKIALDGYSLGENLNFKKNFDTSIKVDLTRLPKPISNRFLGREKELEKINNTFINRSKTGVISLIAVGGGGKSTLTSHWLLIEQQKNYHGISHIFGWSFYSQGSHQQTYTSSNTFFDMALPFFGWKGNLPKYDDEKGRELAKLLLKKPSLLILDGLEPLQESPDDGGQIADVGIKELIRSLHHHRNPFTFVVISSRQSIIELKNREDHVELSLEALNIDESKELLQSFGVNGKESELKAACYELNGHPLSLVLLSSMLVNFRNGDIRYFEDFYLLGENEKHYGHVNRILSYYDLLLNDDERIFMYCLGLFDRPMDRKTRYILFSKADFMKKFAIMTENQVMFIENNLEKKQLINKANESISFNSYRTYWDTHALIRQFFSNQFRYRHPVEFKQAHSILFSYFKSIQVDEKPDTLEGFSSLYRAIYHGCLAGEYYSAYEEVYRKRILRGSEHYSWHVLGSFSEDIKALSSFFSKGWSSAIGYGLTPAHHGRLLAEASFCMMSLGRLDEAISLRYSSIRQDLDLNDWLNASRSAETLAELLTITGNLREAKKIAYQALEYSSRVITATDTNDNPSYRTIAIISYRLGNLTNPEVEFSRARPRQVNTQPSYIYYLRDAQYNIFCLDQSIEEVSIKNNLKRALQLINSSISNDNKLITAFGNLTIAFALKKLNQYEKALGYLNKSIDYVLAAGKKEYAPEFYLTRAEFYLNLGNIEQAMLDLRSANVDIIRCGMKLYAVDATILEARLLEHSCDYYLSIQACNKAEMLIEETGYFLRKSFVSKLKSRVVKSYRKI